MSKWSHYLRGEYFPVNLTISCATTPPKKAAMGEMQALLYRQALRITF
jgi:hypothetical protein